MLIASKRLHLVLIALFPNPISCRESAPHTLLISFVVLSLLIYPSREIRELRGPSRMDKRSFQTGRLVAGGQGMKTESNPQTPSPTKESHRLKAFEKQGFPWAIVTADGRSGDPGPVAGAPPVGEESWSQRTSAR